MSNLKTSDIFRLAPYQALAQLSNVLSLGVGRNFRCFRDEAEQQKHNLALIQNARSFSAAAKPSPFNRGNKAIFEGFTGMLNVKITEIFRLAPSRALAQL